MWPCKNSLLHTLGYFCSVIFDGEKSEKMFETVCCHYYVSSQKIMDRFVNCLNIFFMFHFTFDFISYSYIALSIFCNCVYNLSRVFNTGLSAVGNICFLQQALLISWEDKFSEKEISLRRGTLSIWTYRTYGHIFRPHQSYKDYLLLPLWLYSLLFLMCPINTRPSANLISNQLSSSTQRSEVYIEKNDALLIHTCSALIFVMMDFDTFSTILTFWVRSIRKLCTHLIM